MSNLRPRGLSLKEAFEWHMPGGPPEEGCWEWKGCRHQKHAYGKIRFQKKDYVTHRVSYEIYRGPIPPGMQVLHDPVLCNNPSCVNPNHLRLGTPAENVADIDIAGTRTARGEGHRLSKLNEREVREIRESYANGIASKSELSRRYGVTPSNIGKILNRTIWKHVD